MRQQERSAVNKRFALRRVSRPEYLTESGTMTKDEMRAARFATPIAARDWLTEKLPEYAGAWHVVELEDAA